MIELEKTYLAKCLPENLNECKHFEMLDIYIPASSTHAHLRLRRKGDKFEMTKKTMVDENDASSMLEQTIELDQDEFDTLAKVDGKRLRKIRYYMEYDGHILEIDVFQDELKGLVLVDAEFNSAEEKSRFQMPDFCLVDVTQEEFIAGGMLCGKNYDDIESSLKNFKYTKLQSNNLSV